MRSLRWGGPEVYQFTTNTIAGLRVSSSVAKAGTTHRKVCNDSGVSPSSQNTLNVYVSGEFKFAVGDFEQILLPGNTSLDLAMVEYPRGVECVETVLSQWGQRFCVSCDGPWQRSSISMLGGEGFTAERESLLILLSGELSVGGSRMLSVSSRAAPAGTLIQATAASALVLCWRP